jgi:hypothetical protein
MADIHEGIPREIRIALARVWMEAFESGRCEGEPSPAPNANRAYQELVCLLRRNLKPTLPAGQTITLERRHD